MTPTAEAPEQSSADLVIIGAGLAGLSLAFRLARPEFSHLTVQLLEPRESHQADRTWCYFKAHDHPFAEQVAASWSSLHIRSPESDRVLPLEKPYEMIPAAAFYDAALAAVERAPHIQLRRGLSVTAVEKARAHGRLDVAYGTDVKDSTGRVSARCVFDSRPPAPRPGSLVQHFLGWDLETERRLATDTATLMDFDVAQDGAIHFVYALPWGPHQALVESTWIEPAPHPSRDYEAHLEAWIARHLEGGWRIRRRERGALPMSSLLEPTSRPSKHVLIGSRGGALRPSSGYAFSRIQKMSDALAHQLRTEEWRRRGVRVPRLGHPLDRLMDRLFLRVLRRHPTLAPTLFSTLFGRCPTHRLLRFLNGEGGLRDRGAVIRSLPPRPFLRATAELLRAF